MTEENSPHERLAVHLVQMTPPEQRCEYLRQDGRGVYCGKGLVNGEAVSDMRRMVCDIASLQLWCLDKADCTRCSWYRGDTFRE